MARGPVGRKRGILIMNILEVSNKIVPIKVGKILVGYYNGEFDELKTSRTYTVRQDFVPGGFWDKGDFMEKVNIMVQEVMKKIKIYTGFDMTKKYEEVTKDIYGKINIDCSVCQNKTNVKIDKEYIYKAGHLLATVTVNKNTCLLKEAVVEEIKRRNHRQIVRTKNRIPLVHIYKLTYTVDTWYDPRD